MLFSDIIADINVISTLHENGGCSYGINVIIH